MARGRGCLFASAARPGGLEKYRPNLRYLSIDQRRYDDAALARHDNLVALLFRLGQCREHDRVELLVGRLIGKLKEMGQESLCRAFAVWLDKVILRRLSGGSTTMSDLWEKQAMLSERFDEWEAQFLMGGASTRKERRRSDPDHSAVAKTFW